MKYRIQLLLLCPLFPLLLSGQTVDEIKADESYLWGEGYGESTKEADQAALVDLTNKISISVHNDFTSKERETTVGSTFTSEAEYNNVINTYSNATLTNTQRLVVNPGPKVEIFRYIKKVEIDRIFESRERKVKDLIADADRAESKAQIDDALRYFYWASALLQSLRYPNEVKYTDTEGHEQLASTYITYRMNEIFGNLRVELQDVSDPTNLQLLFTYKGQPVRSMDYTYFDGRDISCLISAKDGLGFVELPPNSILSNLQINVEYEYDNQAHIDQEIKTVVQIIKGSRFPKSRLQLPLLAGGKSALTDSTSKEGSDKQATDASTESNEAMELSKFLKEMTADEPKVEVYQQMLDRIVEAIRTAQYPAVKDCFTDEGYIRFDRLIHYGKARVLEVTDLQFVTLNGLTYCHSLPMTFSFAGNQRKFVEEVAFTFDEAGKICNVSFGLGDKATEDILGQQMWSREARVILTDFLENYKTAYALKNIDYLNAVFSDNALIITGKVLTERVLQNDQYQLKKRVIRTQQSKVQYLKNLQTVFRSNEFINIRFADNRIVKAGKGGEIYGINIQQDYYSSNYGDSGYLFLMVDVNDPHHPIIHVRTWQPEPGLDGVISLNDF